MGGGDNTQFGVYVQYVFCTALYGFWDNSQKLCFRFQKYQ